MGSLLTLFRKASDNWYRSALLYLNGVLPSLIHDYANNRYWNSSAGATSFPFTSVRAGNATLFDAVGNLVWAPANLLLQSDNPTVTWTNTDTTPSLAGSAPSGATAYLMTEGVAGTALSSQAANVVATVPCLFTIELKKGNAQFIRLRIGNTNNVTAWVDLDTGTVSAPTLAGTATAPANPAITALGDGWYMVSVYGEVLDLNPTVLSLTATSSGSTTRVNNGTYYVGRRSVERYAPGAPRLPLQQTTTSYYYGHRISRDPATGSMGLYVEAARTESIVNNTNPGYSVALISKTNGPNYLGGWPSARLTADGTGGSHYGGVPAITPGASELRTVSAFLKNISGSQWTQIFVSTSHAPANAYVNFDLTNGVVGGVGADASNAFIISMGDGLYWCGFSYTTIGVPSGGSPVVIAFVSSTSSARAESNTSSGVVDVLLTSSSVGEGVCSPMLTYGVIATRAAEVLATTSVGWLDQTKGTWYLDFVPYNTAVTTNRRLLSIGDNTAANGFSMTRGTTSVIQLRTVLASVVSFLPVTANSSASFNRAKSAVRLESPNKAVCLDGGAISTASADFPTSGYTAFKVGAEIDASSATNVGIIREIRYYPDASASDGQLQTLTT